MSDRSFFPRRRALLPPLLAVLLSLAAAAALASVAAPIQPLDRPVWNEGPGLTDLDRLAAPGPLSALPGEPDPDAGAPSRAGAEPVRRWLGRQPTIADQRHSFGAPEGILPEIQGPTNRLALVQDGGQEDMIQSLRNLGEALLYMEGVTPFAVTALAAAHTNRSLTNGIFWNYVFLPAGAALLKLNEVIDIKSLIATTTPPVARQAEDGNRLLLVGSPEEQALAQNARMQRDGRQRMTFYQFVVKYKTTIIINLVFISGVFITLAFRPLSRFVFIIIFLYIIVMLAR